MMRLTKDQQLAVAGSYIDRSKTIKSTLQGHPVQGYVGDSLYTALLASEQEELLTASGPEPLSHGFDYQPHILVPIAQADTHTLAPLSHIPLEAGFRIDNARLIKGRGSSKPNLWQRVMGTSTGHLAHHLYDPDLRIRDDQATFGAIPTTELEADYIVIGGGLSGMQLALGLAERKQEVILLEKEPYLGGCGPYFGGQLNKMPIDQYISELIKKVQTHKNIIVETSCEARANTKNSEVIGFRKHIENGHAITQRFLIGAKKMFVATGCVQKAPLFAGNRTPGIIKSYDLFRLVNYYELSAQGPLTFFVSNDEAYKFARKICEAGIDISRIIDTRLHVDAMPIEQCKALGIPLTTGAFLTSAIKDLASSTLTLDVAPAMAETRAHLSSFSTQTLVVCSGWQPTLSFWKQAGGALRFDRDQGHYVAADGPDHLSLCGSVVGYQSHQACIDHAHWIAERQINPQKAGLLNEPHSSNPASQTQFNYRERILFNAANVGAIHTSTGWPAPVDTETTTDSGLFPPSRYLSDQALAARAMITSMPSISLDKFATGLVTSPTNVGSLASALPTVRQERCARILGLHELSTSSPAEIPDKTTEHIFYDRHFAKWTLAGKMASTLVAKLINVSVAQINIPKKFFSFSFAPRADAPNIDIQAQVESETLVHIWLPTSHHQAFIELLRREIKSDQALAQLQLKQVGNRYLKIGAIGEELCSSIYSKMLDGQPWQSAEAHSALYLANINVTIAKTDFHTRACLTIFGPDDGAFGWTKKLRRVIETRWPNLLTSVELAGLRIQASKGDARFDSIAQTKTTSLRTLRAISQNISVPTGLLIFATQQTSTEPANPNKAIGIIVTAPPPAGDEYQSVFAQLANNITSGDVVNGLIGGKNYRFEVL